MINTLLFFAFGKEVAKIVNFFGLLTFALKKSIFVSGSYEKSVIYWK